MSDELLSELVDLKVAEAIRLHHEICSGAHASSEHVDGSAFAALQEAERHIEDEVRVVRETGLSEEAEEAVKEAEEAVEEAEEAVTHAAEVVVVEEETVADETEPRREHILLRKLGRRA